MQTMVHNWTHTIFKNHKRYSQWDTSYNNIDGVVLIIGIVDHHTPHHEIKNRWSLLYLNPITEKLKHAINMGICDGKRCQGSIYMSFNLIKSWIYQDQYNSLKLTLVLSKFSWAVTVGQYPGKNLCALLTPTIANTGSKARIILNTLDGFNIVEAFVSVENLVEFINSSNDNIDWLLLMTIYSALTFEIIMKWFC